MKMAIIFECGDRLVVDTAHPLANIMHDASRPFAVCERVSRNGAVRTLARYATAEQAKRAARYLKRCVVR